MKEFMWKTMQFYMQTEQFVPEQHQMAMLFIAMEAVYG